MNEELATQDAKAARLCGIDKSCGTKVKHPSFAKAASQCKWLNVSKNKKHDCEPYFCCFCSHWHVGRIFDKEQLLIFSTIADMMDDGLNKKKETRLDVAWLLSVIKKGEQNGF